MGSNRVSEVAYKLKVKIIQIRYGVKNLVVRAFRDYSMNVSKIGKKF